MSELRLDEVADGAKPSIGLAGEMLSLAGAMDAQYLLRRSLSEPNMDAARRDALVDALLGSSASPDAIALIKSAVGRQWPSSEALAQAIRDMAIRIAWRATVAGGTADSDRVGVLGLMVLASTNRKVASALGDVTRDPADRQALATALAAEAGPIPLLMAESAVDDQRAGFVDNLSHYLDVLADLRGHQRARVTTAVPMTDSQQETLLAELARIYRRPIDLESVVDQQVIGGVRVDADGDVIDGSIKARIDAAREAIAGVSVEATTASEEEEHA